MKHGVLTVVFVALAMTGSAQYGNGSYDCYRHYKMMADYYVGQKEWNYAAKNVLNMMDAEEDSSWSYLEGKNSVELFDALAEEIVSNPRLMTLNKMICVLAIYDIEKKYEETLALCEKLSDNFGYNEYFNFYKSKSCYALGLETEATKSFVKMMQINPQISSAHNIFLAGKMLYASGNKEMGLAYMSSVIDSCEMTEDYLNYAMACYLQDMYDEAIPYLTTVINNGDGGLETEWYDEDENNYDIERIAMSYFIKILCQNKRGLRYSAEASSRQLLDFEERYNTCLFSGIIYYSRGKEDLADSCIERLLCTTDLSATGHYATAYFLALRGRNKEALEHACRCLDVAFEPLWLQFFTSDPVFSRIKPKVTIYAKKQSKAMAHKYPAKKYKQHTVTLPFSWDSGIMVVTCHVNGIPTNIYFDSGASDVQLSKREWEKMVLSGTVTGDDVIGSVRTINADGSVNNNTAVSLKSLMIGDIRLTDVRANVSESPHSMLLLGQSVLSRFEKVEIDYENFKVTLTYKEEIPHK